MSEEEERQEREAQRVEIERLMRERQERQERAQADRSVEQIIRDKAYQRNYYQNHVKKPVECERCKRIYASVYSMRRHYCCVRGKV